MHYLSDLDLREQFLGFFPATNGLTAVGLDDSIHKVLVDAGIGLDTMVGMSFDGASVMAGVRGGVQELLRQRQSFPRAIFFHCWAHRLNLSLVDICALIPRVRQTLILSRCFTIL